MHSTDLLCSKVITYMKASNAIFSNITWHMKGSKAIFDKCNKQICPWACSPLFFAYIYTYIYIYMCSSPLSFKLFSFSLLYNLSPPLCLFLITSFCLCAYDYCVNLASVDGDILAQCLIELIDYSYKQDASCFLEACLKRTFGLSMIGLEQSWDGWPTEKFSWVRMSEDKVCTKDSCWSMGMVYDSIGLTGVSTTNPGVDKVLQMVSELTLTVSRACVG
jgi:hypothetical protein